MDQDIILVADYHAENIESRRFNQATGEERTGNFATTRSGILRRVEEAAQEAQPGGRVVWIMESTTGWARVKGLLGDRVKFVLARGAVGGSGAWDRDGDGGVAVGAHRAD